MAEIGQKEIKTKWPVEEGLEADEKHDGVENNLVPEEKSYVKQRRALNGR